jgi:hypothetical protein
VNRKRPIQLYFPDLHGKTQTGFSSCFSRTVLAEQSMDFVAENIEINDRLRAQQEGFGNAAQCDHGCLVLWIVHGHPFRQAWR